MYFVKVKRRVPDFFFKIILSVQFFHSMTYSTGSLREKGGKNKGQRKGKRKERNERDVKEVKKK